MRLNLKKFFGCISAIILATSLLNCSAKHVVKTSDREKLRQSFSERLTSDLDSVGTRTLETEETALEIIITPLDSTRGVEVRGPNGVTTIKGASKVVISKSKKATKEETTSRVEKQKSQLRDSSSLSVRENNTRDKKKKGPQAGVYILLGLVGLLLIVGFVFKVKQKLTPVSLIKSIINQLKIIFNGNKN